jgi:5'(3')-deoxyribonucleotidase
MKATELPIINFLQTPNVQFVIPVYQRNYDWTLSELFNTFISSTAPWEHQSAMSDKLNWVKEYLRAPAYKRLILSHNKPQLRGLLEG